MMELATLTCGTVLTVAGLYGPEDEGVTMLAGLVLVGLAVWKGLFP